MCLLAHLVGAIIDSVTFRNCGIKQSTLECITVNKSVLCVCVKFKIKLDYQYMCVGSHEMYLLLQFSTKKFESHCSEEISQEYIQEYSLQHCLQEKKTLESNLIFYEYMQFVVYFYSREVQFSSWIILGSKPVD